MKYQNLLIFLFLIKLFLLGVLNAQSLDKFDKYAYGKLPPNEGKIVRTIKEYFRKQNLIDYFNSENPFKRSIAVVIGVNNYSKSQDFSNLNLARKDAIDVRTFLLDFGFDVVYQFLDYDANPLIIKSLMKHLIRSLDENDRFFFYFSGHGDYKKLPQHSNQPGEASFLVFGNANKYLDEGVLELDEIYRWSRNLYCSSQLFVLDCCYSGNIVKYKDATSEKPKGLDDNISLASTKEFLLNLAKPGRYILTSSAIDEKTVELNEKEFKGSLFTQVFLKGIRDQEAEYVKDGIITIEEIALYLSQIPKLKIRKFGTVTPQVIPIDLREKGKFFFIKPGTKLNLKSKSLEEIAFKSRKEMEVDISIKTIPIGASFEIDDEKIGTKTEFKTTFGKHKLFIELDGYIPIVETIDVNENNKSFEFKLQKSKKYVQRTNSIFEIGAFIGVDYPASSLNTEYYEFKKAMGVGLSWDFDFTNILGFPHYYIGLHFEINIGNVRSFQGTFGPTSNEYTKLKSGIRFQKKFYFDDLILILKPSMGYIETYFPVELPTGSYYGNLEYDEMDLGLSDFYYAFGIGFEFPVSRMINLGIVLDYNYIRYKKMKIENTFVDIPKNTNASNFSLNFIFNMIPQLYKK